METPTIGSVVLIPFPFSDLSQSKLRPTIILADINYDNWIFCQVTSNPYFDPISIEMTQSAFLYGSLQRISYARPGKLFTGNSTLIVKQVGLLKFTVIKKISETVINLFQTSLQQYPNKLQEPYDKT